MMGNVLLGTIFHCFIASRICCNKLYAPLLDATKETKDYAYEVLAHLQFKQAFTLFSFTLYKVLLGFFNFA